MKTMALFWDQIQKNTVPKSTTETQLKEMRLFFYIGAYTLYKAQGQIEKKGLSLNDRKKILRDLEMEIHAFFEEFVDDDTGRQCKH